MNLPIERVFSFRFICSVGDERRGGVAARCVGGILNILVGNYILTKLVFIFWLDRVFIYKKIRSEEQKMKGSNDQFLSVGFVVVF
jgi:hypothetical protein